MTREISKKLMHVVFVIAIIITVIIAHHFTTKEINDTIISSISYSLDSNVDYRVFYTDNPYFDEAYIEKDNTYIASLINNIDVDFDYYVNYTDSLKGKYNYYVKATIIAIDSSNPESIYWQKSYNLTEKQEIDFIDTKDYRINESVSVNYQYFNNLLNQFKNNLMLNLDSYLKVELIVENHGEYKEVKPFTHRGSISLDIPLSENAINIQVNEDTNIEEETFVAKEDNQRKRINAMIIGGIIWLVAIILSAWFALRYHHDVKEEGEYSRKLRKILNTYDSVIVNVKELPKLSDLKVINVTTFEELIDAQSEVRLPINFKEDKKKKIAKFILVRNNLAWVYTLKEGNEKKKATM